ncbi:MAG: trimethylamine methyltransferase family protein [Bacillota bacterium]|nr:trimethylamine methyltransferase family protein [Bacillota bacterium]
MTEKNESSKREIRPVRYKTTLDLLTTEEAEAVNRASLDILEKVGVKMPLPAALDVLGQCGATVDRDSGRVCFPPELVLSALEKAPPGFTLCAPDPANDLSLDGYHGYLSLDGSGLQIIDPENGEMRRSTFTDLENAVRVADYLEAIAFLWPVISAQDCPQEKQPLYELLAMLKNSTKHAQAMTAVDPETARGSVEIAAAVAGGKEALRRRPLISNFQCSISPLAYDPDGLAAAMIFADAGIPTGFLTMQVGCSTAPATLAGSLAQANAEILAGITFLQSYCPGCPTFYGSCGTVMELRSGAVASGGPEDFLLQALSAQMARYYNLPANVGTFATGAKAANWHAGVENAVSGTVSVFAGADMMCGAGLLAGAVIFSYIQLLFDCEIYEIIRRTAEGIKVDSETLAFDTIERVGSGDHFMVEPHTLAHMRELWQPTVINRSPYGRYQAEGCREAEDNALEEARRILAEYHPEPLEKKLQDEIIAIIESSR